MFSFRQRKYPARLVSSGITDSSTWIIGLSAISSQCFILFVFVAKLWVAPSLVDFLVVLPWNVFLHPRLWKLPWPAITLLIFNFVLPRSVFLLLRPFSWCSFTTVIFWFLQKKLCDKDLFNKAPVKIRKKLFCDCSRGILHRILDSISEIMLKFFFVAFWSWKQNVARINFPLVNLPT